MSMLNSVAVLAATALIVSSTPLLAQSVGGFEGATFTVTPFGVEPTKTTSSPPIIVPTTFTQTGLTGCVSNPSPSGNAFCNPVHQLFPSRRVRDLGRYIPRSPGFVGDPFGRRLFNDFSSHIRSKPLFFSGDISGSAGPVSFNGAGGFFEGIIRFAPNWAAMF